MFPCLIVLAYLRFDNAVPLPNAYQHLTSSTPNGAGPISSWPQKMAIARPHRIKTPIALTAELQTRDIPCRTPPVASTPVSHCSRPHQQNAYCILLCIARVTPASSTSRKSGQWEALASSENILRRWSCRPGQASQNDKGASRGIYLGLTIRLTSAYRFVLSFVLMIGDFSAMRVVSFLFFGIAITVNIAAEFSIRGPGEARSRRRNLPNFA